MRNCPKCSSENIKKTDLFAREIKDGQEPQMLSDQMINYRCEDCNNEWHVKFGEDSD